MEDRKGVCLQSLPYRSPNLNAHAERFVRSIREECLDRVMLFSEGMLRNALREYVEHYNHERLHQGLDGKIPIPRPVEGGRKSRFGHLVKSRLGGLLNHYFNSAA